VEVELVDSEYPDLAAPALGGKTFVDPDAANALSDRTTEIKVKAGNLRYRVRFCYPVDPLADPGAGDRVDPAIHYLLDTPVFDDISVTYFSKTRYLSLHEASE
jgi:hypothetical protein